MNFHDEMINKKCGAVVIAIWYLHMESPIEFAPSLENAWFQYNFFTNACMQTKMFMHDMKQKPQNYAGLKCPGRMGS
jgi:hypothetical protein